MLSRSDTDIVASMQYFAPFEVNVAFLVPTQTGYEKSIMDATSPVRSLLKEAGLHDYEMQGQGEENKKTVKAFLVYSGATEEVRCSLYRPVTKHGDPRIWFSKLRQYCKPWNLLALVATNDSIYIFNMSDCEVVNGFTASFGAAKRVLTSISHGYTGVVEELRAKIQEIHDRGFIQAVHHGDTSVGMTLENALGIEPNDYKGPDYKGIELKASRKAQKTKKGGKNRVTLFSQVPEWEASHYSERKLLDEWGYYDQAHDRLALYCTVSAHQPNTQGLYFNISSDDLLWTVGQKQEKAKPQNLVFWEMETLKDRLLEKHHETFWVKASVHEEQGVEYFRYDRIVHTKNPLVVNLETLIDEKIITMDFLIHEKKQEEGGGLRDHGFLFKIRPAQVNLLFPEPEEFDLMTT